MLLYTHGILYVAHVMSNELSRFVIIQIQIKAKENSLWPLWCNWIIPNDPLIDNTSCPVVTVKGVANIIKHAHLTSVPNWQPWEQGVPESYY